MSRLTRRFGGRTVVDNVTFEVGRGEIVVLLGPNGAGKTTTLRMLAGLLATSSGTVAIDGVQLTRATGGALRGRIGFLTESPALWDRLSVRENLRVYAGLHALASPDAAIDRVLELVELSDRADSRTAELSRGMRQKVALARALLHDPAILLFDEPTSSLDPEMTRRVRQLLTERRTAGCAILVSTHNLDEAERLADRVAVLHGRLLALDPPEALRRRLTTGRLIVRVTGEASAFLRVGRSFDAHASAEGSLLALKAGADQTPAVVRAFFEAGAGILEVRPEIPALEDVYFHLVGDDPAAAGAHR